MVSGLTQPHCILELKFLARPFKRRSQYHICWSHHTANSVRICLLLFPAFINCRPVQLAQEKVFFPLVSQICQAQRMGTQWEVHAWQRYINCLLYKQLLFCHGDYCIYLLAMTWNLTLFQMKCCPKVEILGDTIEPFDIWVVHQIGIGAWPHVTSWPWHSPHPPPARSAKITKSVCDAFGRGGTVDGNLALFMDQRCWHCILCIWAHIYIIYL